MSDGGENVRRVQEHLHPFSEHLIDWFHITMRLTVLQQQTLEKASQSWPIPLQRRFGSALRRRKQEPWPYTPYQGNTVRPRFYVQ